MFGRQLISLLPATKQRWVAPSAAASNRWNSLAFLSGGVLTPSRRRLHEPKHLPGPAVFATRPSSSSSKRGNKPNTPPQQQQEESQSRMERVSGYRRPVVQWYPGHIARAERMLKDSFLKAVDVVVEVRDARVAKATSHPRVATWCASKPRIVALTHADQIPAPSLRAWKAAYQEFGAERFNGNEDENEEIRNQARQAAKERAKYNSKDDRKKKTSQDPLSASSSSTVAPIQEVLFVNAKEGSGIPALTRAIFKAGAHVQERRARRGLKERALRVGVLGYPNVGKSAIINRLLGRKRARSANTPGVTRTLQWIRIRNSATPDASGQLNTGPKEFELLDTPGIIPLSMGEAQSDGTLLAACNCIGDNAYDNQEVAAYLCEWILSMHRLGYAKQAAPGWRSSCISRYRFDPLKRKEIVTLQPPSMFDDDEEEEVTTRPRTGEDMLYEVADNTCQGDPEDAARKILQDFRSGRMGPICLQIAPRSKHDPGQIQVLNEQHNVDERERRLQEEWARQMQQERAQAAREAAGQMGLELPPVLKQQREEQEQQQQNLTGSKEDVSSDDAVGKGLFDGW